MFTEKDILHYLDQIQQIEHRMRDTYQNLHDQITHPEYKEIFGRMANEEKAHAAIVENLKHLLVEQPG